jgi:hypothetical protein
MCHHWNTRDDGVEEAGAANTDAPEDGAEHTGASGSGVRGWEDYSEAGGGTSKTGGGRSGCDMDDWWADRSLPQKVLLVIAFILLGIGLLAAFGWVVMLLWNWLMPEIFGLTRLSYWQAWGLLILCFILFKDIDLSSDESGRRIDRRRKRELRRYIREEQSSGGGLTGETPQP